jgi:uncharacterized spore protein YtfJ
MSQTILEPAGALQQLREIVEGAVTGHIFGTPIEQDGMIVLPVAKVGGGGGGGGGSAPTPSKPGSGPAPAGANVANGGGGGLGLAGKPLGVFVIKDGKVRWQPAIDVNRVILGGQIVAVAALLTIRTLLRAHARSSS